MSYNVFGGTFNLAQLIQGRFLVCRLGLATINLRTNMKRLC